MHITNQIIQISGPKAATEQSNHFDLLGQLDKKSTDDFDPGLLEDLMGLNVSSPTKSSSENEDSPARFSAQWNKLFGQDPKPIDDSTVPDLKLDTLGQMDDDFGSFFSASANAQNLQGGKEGGKIVPPLLNPPPKSQQNSAILPSQLFDLDQSLFSVQSPRQGMQIRVLYNAQ